MQLPLLEPGVEALDEYRIRTAAEHDLRRPARRSPVVAHFSTCNLIHTITVTIENIQIGRPALLASEEALRPTASSGAAATIPGVHRAWSPAAKRPSAGYRVVAGRITVLVPDVANLPHLLWRTMERKEDGAGRPAQRGASQ
ncbi:hypothetical protein DL770_003199 [Monosporascus sp. CRB-9-2]|nr:hypothetical protein DL770_003199 [Monosporascus sp. CRB-9-2]